MKRSFPSRHTQGLLICLASTRASLSVTVVFTVEIPSLPKSELSEATVDHPQQGTDLDMSVVPIVPPEKEKKKQENNVVTRAAAS
ncbi:hypothetical protein B0T10DRAFT_482323 [Thelonectria olida]|uniref:Secreted protein n=1 Tax=Thelonectria olida TaxID=1576542 RepID=A0A9P9ARY4_9HYPO|nr:hypothetical protein B0T10DRAFT_482323 [Thelonectria olida]